MRHDEAVELLGSDLDSTDAGLLGPLAERLGEWPLLLKLVNRQLRLYRESGLEGAVAIERLEAKLARGLDKLEIGREENRAEAVSLTMQYSLDALDPKDRFRYLDLAVFPEDTDVPLVALSLLLRFDLATETIRLHDVFREYLLGQHEDLTKLHRIFLDFCRPPSGRFTDLGEDHVYLWRHLAWHLIQANESAQLNELLFDSAYLRGKLVAVGVNALLADYDFFVDDEDARLVQGALRLSAHVLEGHTNWVRSVAVLDANRVVFASDDQTLRVWDVESGRTAAVFTLDAPVWSVAFIPVRRIVIAGDNTSVHFLDLVPPSDPKDENPEREEPAPTATDESKVLVHTVSEAPPSSVDAILITAITREREAVLEELRTQQLAPVRTPPSP